MTVTYSRKRYVRVCLGCDLLFHSQRADQLTCSAACRVRTHRNGGADRLRSFCGPQGLDVDPARVLGAKALQLLRPDLADRVMAERGFTAEQWRGDLWRAYWDVLMQDRQADPGIEAVA